MQGLRLLRGAAGSYRLEYLSLWPVVKACLSEIQFIKSLENLSLGNIYESIHAMLECKDTGGKGHTLPACMKKYEFGARRYRWQML